MNIKTFKITCEFAVCLLAQPVMAGPLEDGQAAYDRKDFATALHLLRPLAAHGNAIAQTMLGAMYASGDGVPRDDAEAVKWFQMAADQGDKGSQYVLAIMYENGSGVQDYVQAYKWFYLAGTPKGLARVAAHMTPSQIAEAKRVARKWKPKQ